MPRHESGELDPGSPYDIHVLEGEEKSDLAPRRRVGKSLKRVRPSSRQEEVVPKDSKALERAISQKEKRVAKLLRELPREATQPASVERLAKLLEVMKLVTDLYEAAKELHDEPLKVKYEKQGSSLAELLANIGQLPHAEAALLTDDTLGVVDAIFPKEPEPAPKQEEEVVGASDPAAPREEGAPRGLENTPEWIQFIDKVRKTHRGFRVPGQRGIFSPEEVEEIVRGRFTFFASEGFKGLTPKRKGREIVDFVSQAPAVMRDDLQMLLGIMGAYDGADMGGPREGRRDEREVPSRPVPPSADLVPNPPAPQTETVPPEEEVPEKEVIQPVPAPAAPAAAPFDPEAVVSSADSGPEQPAPEDSFRNRGGSVAANAESGARFFERDTTAADFFQRLKDLGAAQVKTKPGVFPSKEAMRMERQLGILYARLYTHYQTISSKTFLSLTPEKQEEEFGRMTDKIPDFVKDSFIRVMRAELEKLRAAPVQNPPPGPEKSDEVKSGGVETPVASSPSLAAKERTPFTVSGSSRRPRFANILASLKSKIMSPNKPSPAAERGIVKLDGSEDAFTLVDQSPDFAEFLIQYPDAEEVVRTSNSEKIKQRYEVYAAKEEVAKKLFTIGAEAFSTETGIAIEDLSDSSSEGEKTFPEKVNEYITGLAVENPEAVLELQKALVRYAEAPAKIAEKVQKIEAFRPKELIATKERLEQDAAVLDKAKDSSFFQWLYAGIESLTEKSIPEVRAEIETLQKQPPVELTTEQVQQKIAELEGSVVERERYEARKKAVSIVGGASWSDVFLVVTEAERAQLGLNELRDRISHVSEKISSVEALQEEALTIQRQIVEQKFSLIHATPVIQEMRNFVVAAVKDQLESLVSGGDTLTKLAEAQAFLEQVSSLSQNPDTIVFPNDPSEAKAIAEAQQKKLDQAVFAQIVKEIGAGVELVFTKKKGKGEGALSQLEAALSTSLLTKEKLGSAQGPKVKEVLRAAFTEFLKTAPSSTAEEKMKRLHIIQIMAKHKLA